MGFPLSTTRRLEEALSAMPFPSSHKRGRGMHKEREGGVGPAGGVVVHVTVPVGKEAAPGENTAAGSTGDEDEAEEVAGEEQNIAAEEVHGGEVPFSSPCRWGSTFPVGRSRLCTSSVDIAPVSS